MASRPDRSRQALLALSRDRLGEIAGELGVTPKDARSKDSYVDALLEAGTDLASVFGMCKRADLKAVCSSLEIDDGGRELGPIIARIVAALGLETKPLALAAETNGGERQPTPRGSRSRGGASMAGEAVADYRHDATRKNNPLAGQVDLDKPPAQPTKKYAYDPHLDPRLEWSGKKEHTSFDVDTVSLHIHEQVSTQAILRVAKREDVQRSLFAEPELAESKQIDFYSHDVGWRNRLVLGDSLLVMNSLLEREQMAGKVQCIYVDPPYGVNYRSNFQPAVSRREVKDDDASLTREPEQIQAYRDTWTLGVHSYLTYLRDRLLLARDLLADTGSVFVQIGEENIHLVRCLLDEVFGADNFVSLISYRTSAPLRSSGLPSVSDYILWYGKDKATTKFRYLFVPRETGEKSRFTNVELPNGDRRSLTQDERLNPEVLPRGSRPFTVMDLASSGYTPSCTFDFRYNGKVFKTSSGKSWKTTREGMERLAKVGRLSDTGETLRYVLYLDDFPVMKLANSWSDTAGESSKSYVVQTHTKVVERCILMSTDPGDLVFDPTCGSGTTAYVAEQFGRRWISCDTSRVALIVARQRLIAGSFPYYRLRSSRVRDGFVYRTAPHITLGSIAQNSKLDLCKNREEQERLIRESAEQEAEPVNEFETADIRNY